MCLIWLPEISVLIGSTPSYTKCLPVKHTSQVGCSCSNTVTSAKSKLFLIIFYRRKHVRKILPKNKQVGPTKKECGLPLLLVCFGSPKCFLSLTDQGISWINMEEKRI